jgi:hypothetical protein
LAEQSELSRQKLQAVVDLLNTKIKREKSEWIDRKEAKSEGQRAERVILEETETFMEPDFFRIFKIRCLSPYQESLGILT